MYCYEGWIKKGKLDGTYGTHGENNILVTVVQGQRPLGPSLHERITL